MIGVKTMAVASLEKKIVIALPAIKRLTKSSLREPLARSSSAPAIHSKSPLYSAAAEIPISPSMKSRTFHCVSTASNAKRNDSSPKPSTAMTPTPAQTHAGTFFGRIPMRPIAIIAIRSAAIFVVLITRVSTEVAQVILAIGAWPPGGAAQSHATKFARGNAGKSGLTKTNLE